MSLSRFSAGHAQYVISQLLDSVLEAAQPRLTATRVEGDAVVFYALSDRDVSTAGSRGDEIGGAIVDLAQSYYRRRSELVLRNLCPCDACDRIAELELKVVVHRGPVMHYRLQGMEDLGGVAVIAAHRLLNNSLGRSRYVLVTRAAEEVRLPFRLAQSGHRESYGEVGELLCDVYELEPGTGIPEEATTDSAPMGTKTRDIVAKLRKNAEMLRRTKA